MCSWEPGTGELLMFLQIRGITLLLMLHRM